MSARFGITSACAEQTLEIHADKWPAEDHLRVCGADEGCERVGVFLEGSPPRVRSRPRQFAGGRGRLGITSACAEQTAISRSACWAAWDHLRVCGADLRLLESMVFVTGSPPRVRSRLHRHPRP